MLQIIVPSFIVPVELLLIKVSRYFCLSVVVQGLDVTYLAIVPVPKLNILVQCFLVVTKRYTSDTWKEGHTVP